MKALLICPSERIAVAALAENVPLSNLPVLGRPVIEYWLEHLVTLGAKEVHVLAADRPEQVRTLVGSGARWGLRVVVHPEIRELTPEEAFARYCSGDTAAWLRLPHGVTLIEHLPGLAGLPLFSSYTGWFEALKARLSCVTASDRIGMREIKPGVWAGRNTRIAPAAELRAPCWLGENVYVGSGAVVGPMVVIEDKALIESEAEITDSVIGPETLVGEFTEVRHSIALGSMLVNWRLESCVEVPDVFLLCPLAPKRSASTIAGLIGRVVALPAMLVTLPIALLPIVRAWLRGRPALRRRWAVRPRAAHAVPMTSGTLRYLELAETRGWIRRWPQLWSIVRGDFVWIGNRPLGPQQAARLTNDFERLWLEAPIGLISLADAEGCTCFLDDESRAHSSYYSTQAGLRLDLSVLVRTLFLIVSGVSCSRIRGIFRGFCNRIMKRKEEGFDHGNSAA